MSEVLGREVVVVVPLDVHDIGRSLSPGGTSFRQVLEETAYPLLGVTLIGEISLVEGGNPPPDQSGPDQEDMMSVFVKGDTPEEAAETLLIAIDAIHQKWLAN
jgi:hypothetical protein